MNPGFFYCSALARQAGEQTFGTASAGDSWLLLEYPHPWGFRAFQESALSRTVKMHLSRALKTNARARLLLIKQEREARDHLTLFVARSRAREASIVKFKLTAYEQLLELNLTALLRGDDPAGVETLTEPVFLVCTHGKRDKCCAKFGFSLYKALREGGNAANVWQSSHVGGDRFAANLLCFPHGLFYAHVTIEAGRRIIEEYSQSRLSLENYRGRACYPSPIQAAEYFARAESGLNGLDDLRFLDYEPIRERNWRVRFSSPKDNRTHEVYLQSRLSDFQNLLTCHSLEEKSVVQYSLSEYRVAG